MSISVTGSIWYRGGAWRYSGQDVVVSCDHEGCDATVKASGLEHNGAEIEAIYGCDGWHLHQRTWCPEHAPTLAGPCPEGEDGQHAVRSWVGREPEYVDGEWVQMPERVTVCDSCGACTVEEVTP